MASENYIREFSGQIIGIIETDEKTGDLTARAWPSRQIVGFYRKKYDYTTDFYGKVVAKGNSVVNLIYEDRERRITKGLKNSLEGDQNACYSDCDDDVSLIYTYVKTHKIEHFIYVQFIGQQLYSQKRYKKKKRQANTKHKLEKLLAESQ